MKKIITLTLILFTISFFGQNTFPTSGNVGIGTTSPAKSLELKGNDGIGIRLFNQNSNTWDLLNSQYGKLDFVRGGNNTFMRIDQNGRVGIGTTSPSEKLQIGNNGFTFHDGGHKVLTFNPVTTNSGAIRYDVPNQRFTFETRVNGSLIPHMNIQRDGNVLVYGKIGIGTTNPDEKLTVKGKIHAEEIRVDLSVPADYVFQQYYTGSSTLKETYKMPTLAEVEAFTKKNHHLPEMPSAKQIKEEGLHLKEMTNLLLQKIEELTLYTIEQEKRIKALEGRLKEKN